VTGEKVILEIIDTHQHVWDLDLFPYRWCKPIPTLNRSFRMWDYKEATQGLSVRGSVLVEADVDDPFVRDETKYLLSLADKEERVRCVVASGRPERKDFKEYLKAISPHPALKGIRRVLHTNPDPLSQSDPFIENLKLLGEQGLSFDLCVLARQLPLALRLIEKCENVSFVLDHCGVPQVKERVLDPWREHLKKISEFKNVACKISGLVAYADTKNWTPEDLRPYVRHVIDCFGWERVMFGSDWPVCTLSATLKQWVDTLSLLTENDTDAQRHKLFHENAIRIYRLA
jgi:predicted TIM-barrel fold metal-dependent hydrolase